MLILWPFLKIRSFSNFAGILRPMSGELWQDKPSIRCLCGSPLIRGNKRNTEQWASTRWRMDCLSRQNSSLIRPQNPAKFENDRIWRNGHRIKITQPNLMIYSTAGGKVSCVSRYPTVSHKFPQETSCPDSSVVITHVWKFLWLYLGDNHFPW